MTEKPTVSDWEALAEKEVKGHLAETRDPLHSLAPCAQARSYVGLRRAYTTNRFCFPDIYTSNKRRGGKFSFIVTPTLSAS